ncbi:hypothetical protein OCK74_01635 [Chitinophagaceae bacterium LB-8]|uniref:Uncharacterized protein n=1 Tax=Paraflavisolibacter caeni TaxID=2982496 RepID=A0A9X3B6V6_9BACT|nr:hypothetical protein [Paraflavisolibacter caeni]MCU7547791.1 hypothetical protein [Paraflavisolibacter caeni]
MYLLEIEPNILAVIIFLSIIVSLVIGKLIFGWYAEISKRNAYMEETNNLLKGILEILQKKDQSNNKLTDLNDPRVMEMIEKSFKENK